MRIIISINGTISIMGYLVTFKTLEIINPPNINKVNLNMQAPCYRKVLVFHMYIGNAHE